MRKIIVNAKMTKHLYREYLITDEQFENLKLSTSLRETIGGNSFNDLMRDLYEEESYDMDYAVTDDNGIAIIAWDY